MKIYIITQPHRLQRYNTCGDWFTDKTRGIVHINVSELGSWRMELLIAVHELVEAFQCMNDGVAEEAVDKFDKEFVERDKEPGDSPKAPYAKQHCLATGIERILASTLGVQWEEYENRLEALIVEREEYDKRGENLSGS